MEFVREDAHGNRDGDAFGIENPESALATVSTFDRIG
jgi:hypothetical protein